MDLHSRRCVSYPLEYTNYRIRKSSEHPKFGFTFDSGLSKFSENLNICYREVITERRTSNFPLREQGFKGISYLTLAILILKAIFTQ